MPIDVSIYTSTLGQLKSVLHVGIANTTTCGTLLSPAIPHIAGCGTFSRMYVTVKFRYRQQTAQWNSTEKSCVSVIRTALADD